MLKDFGLFALIVLVLTLVLFALGVRESTKPDAVFYAVCFTSGLFISRRNSED